MNVITDLNKEWSEQSLQVLPAPDKNFVIWDWSPDGKKLIGTFSDGQVGCYSFETNRYERIAESGAYPMWLPDSSRYISFSDGRVYLGEVSSKRLREIMKLETQIRSIAISRDAQMIYFTVQASESDIWLLDLQ